MSNLPTVIGVETEFALAPGDLASAALLSSDAISPDAFHTVSVDDLLRTVFRARAGEVMREIQASVPHLRAERLGMFLANGSRVYEDIGHLEYCTAEALSPEDATAEVLGGAALLAKALAARNAAHPGQELALFAQNLDYDDERCAAWGCHESYSFVASAARVRAAILPHLCSRIVFSGAGGFDPRHPLRFLISPRAVLIPFARERAEEEALFHSRVESHTGLTTRRLHLICGESLRGHLGTYLKLGTTALLVHLADMGCEIDAGHRPLHPLAALETFATDISLCAKTACQEGMERSALQIQFALLEFAERSAVSFALPDWAQPLLRCWREVLLGLARQGKAGVNRSLDWGIKWSLFDAHCQSRGMSFDRLLAWGPVLENLVRSSPQFRAELSRQRSACAALTPAIRRYWSRLLATSAGQPPMTWDELPTVLDLRLQLREIDWRFAQIGGGPFERLEANGVLRHAVSGITSHRIRRSMNYPLSLTRAQTRGRIIRRLASSGANVTAMGEWTRIIDPARNRVISLQSPIVQNPRWHAIRPRGADDSSRFERAIELYRRSRFAESNVLLGRLRKNVKWSEVDCTVENSYAFRLLRYSAWVGARLGKIEAIEFLRQIHGEGIDERSYFKVADHLYCYRFVQAEPHPDIEAWIAPAFQLLQGTPHLADPHQAAIREHLSAYLLNRGLFDEAETILGDCVKEGVTWRRVRAYCILAEIERRRGRFDRARGLLEMAKSGTDSADEVLLAEQVSPVLARLTMEPAARAEILTHAAEVLRKTRHPMALKVIVELQGDSSGASK